MNDSFKYPGDELVLFQHAIHWKKYFSKLMRPFIKGTVLEVGAGIGSTTILLNDGSASQWVLLEPDEQMSSTLEERIKEFPSNSKVQQGNIDKVNESFDTILYVDVLEHIEDDKLELQKAVKLLKPGGHIIILAPAFQSLYSPFDKSIGHFRRYSRKKLNAIKPPETECVNCRYYDSMGFFASVMNKYFLKQKYPSLKQVKFWDNVLIPVSRLTDKLFFHSFGKTIISTWQKEK